MRIDHSSPKWLELGTLVVILTLVTNTIAGKLNILLHRRVCIVIRRHFTHRDIQLLSILSSINILWNNNLCTPAASKHACMWLFLQAKTTKKSANLRCRHINTQNMYNMASSTFLSWFIGHDHWPTFHFHVKKKTIFAHTVVHRVHCITRAEVEVT